MIINNITFLLLLLIFSCKSPNTNSSKEETTNTKRVSPQYQKDLEYKDLNKRWYDVIYKTVALEMNKELASNKLKEMDEKTLHEFTKCCHTNIIAKYPDIYELVDKDGVLNQKYTTEFKVIMEKCFTDIVEPYIKSKN